MIGSYEQANAWYARQDDPIDDERPEPDVVIEQQIGESWEVVSEFDGDGALAAALDEARKLRDEGLRIEAGGVLRFAKQYRVRLV